MPVYNIIINNKKVRTSAKKAVIAELIGDSYDPNDTRPTTWILKYSNEETWAVVEKLKKAKVVHEVIPKLGTQEEYAKVYIPKKQSSEE